MINCTGEFYQLYEVINCTGEFYQHYEVINYTGEFYQLYDVINSTGEFYQLHEVINCTGEFWTSLRDVFRIFYSMPDFFGACKLPAVVIHFIPVRGPRIFYRMQIQFILSVDHYLLSEAFSLPV